MQIGVGATILVHILLLVLLPDSFDSGEIALGEERTRQEPVYDIEMMSEMFPEDSARQPQKPPMNFVETNPDAPDNVPDDTNNFGAQNQQAAQLTPPKNDGGDRPELDGRTDIAPTQIVSGTMSESRPASPPVPPSPEEIEAAAAQMRAEIAREQVPLPGVEKDIGDNPDTFGTNVAKIAPHPEDVEEWKKGAPDTPVKPLSPEALRAVVNPTRPRPRPQLAAQSRARPAVFAQNTKGTKNLGMPAVDARWSRYGEYLQKLVEAVQMQFDKLIDDSRSYPTSNSMVRVKFVLNAQGEIARILSVEGGEAGPQAEGWCVSSISNPAPYGKWTEDMVALLGEEQEMTFSFFFH